MLFRACRTVPLVFIAVVSLSSFTSSQKQNSPKSADQSRWESLIPQIKAYLAQTHQGCEREWPIGIANTADLTGDGVPEAVVNFCDGGAYTDWFVVMRLEAGKPVIAKVRNRDGKVFNAGLAAGSSVMHSAGYELHPEQRAFYDIKIDFEHDEEGVVTSEKRIVDVFVWNVKTKLFEWDAKLSSEHSSKAK